MASLKKFQPIRLSRSASYSIANIQTNIYLGGALYLDLPIQKSLKSLKNTTCRPRIYQYNEDYFRFLL